MKTNKVSQPTISPPSNVWNNKSRLESLVDGLKPIISQGLPQSTSNVSLSSPKSPTKNEDQHTPRNHVVTVSKEAAIDTPSSVISEPTQPEVKVCLKNRLRYLEDRHSPKYSSRKH